MSILATLFSISVVFGAVAKVDHATGTGCSNNSCSLADLTATISSGVTCAIVAMDFREDVSSLTVVWDPTGANQSFTRIGTGVFSGSRIEFFRLINPTAGATKVVRADWTTDSDVVFTFVTFSGTDTSTCINASNTTTATGTGTSVSIAVTSAATTDFTVASGAQEVSNWSATNTCTAVTLDNSIFVNGAGSYCTGGVSNTHTWTQLVSGAWVAMGVNVIAPSATSCGRLTLLGVGC